MARDRTDYVEKDECLDSKPIGGLDTRVRFWLSADDSVTCYIENGKLVVHASDPLVVYPAVSNEVKVGIRSRQ